VDLGSLRVNHLSDAGWAWYQDYLAVLDAYDLEGYAAFLAPEVSVQFGNDEPLRGREDVTAGLGAFWGSVTGLGWRLLHEPLNVYGEDSRFVLEALNHYDRGDGPRVTVRATAWTDRRDDGLVTSVRLYQDVSPLYAPRAG
jgi:hypothetical protein